LDLGAVPSGGGFFSGDIAEVKIFNSALSDGDRIAEENALKCKYGLGGGAVPATPAGLTATAGNRQVTLNWMPTAGTISYNLWRSTNQGAPYSLTATGLTTASYIDTNAVSGLTNFYEVAATDGCGSSANSAAVSVFLPQPILGFSLGTSGSGMSSLIFNWPGWANDWLLSSATNLTPPAVWFPVTNAVGSNAGQFKATVPIGSGMRFFRLSAP
jgi:hypothetical protein